jgi:DNA-binding HxlR family transcriptional regulator
MTAATAQPRACSVARTLELVGEKWALLAVREVFLGNRRFDEMVRRTGAPRDTMAARLRTLAGAGILERRQYSEHPARYEYRLTDAHGAAAPLWAPGRGDGDLRGLRRAAGGAGHHPADRRRLTAGGYRRLKRRSGTNQITDTVANRA